MLWDTRKNLNKCHLFLAVKNGQGFEPHWKGIGNESKAGQGNVEPAGEEEMMVRAMGKQREETEMKM